MLNYNEEMVEEVKNRLVGKIVRVEHITRPDQGEYSLSIGKVPVIKKTVSDRLKEVIDHKDSIEFVLDGGSYTLQITAADEQFYEDLSLNMKAIIGCGLILDLDEKNSILTLFGAAPLDDEAFAYAVICFIHSSMRNSL